MTPTLLTLEGLAKQAKTTRATVEKIIKTKKLQPVHSAKVGRGLVSFYDPIIVVPVIKNELAVKKAIAEAPQPSIPPAPASIDLKPVTSRLDDIEEALETLSKKLDRLAEQGPLLLRAIEKMHADVLESATKPAEQKVVFAEEPATVVSTPAPPEVVVPKKPNVVVIGLIPNQKQMIDKEFSTSLRLSFYESDDAKGKQFTSHCASADAVFCMTAFMNHGIDAALKSSGTKAVRISGGMTSLRTALTSYSYPNKSDQKQ